MEKYLLTLLLSLGVILFTRAQSIPENNLKNIAGYNEIKSNAEAFNYTGEDISQHSDLHNTGSGKSQSTHMLVPPVFRDTIVFRSKLENLPAFYVTPNNIKLDCVYVDSYEYYNVWNTQKLNPYGFDGLDLKDTIRLPLLDKEKNETDRSPLDDTYITSDFGLRRAEWHYGTDIRVKVGTPIYAPFDGVVRINQYERHGYGRYMVIRHKNGLETLYGHMSKTLYKVGDEVKAGDVIGYGGSTGHSTGPHLHFEIRYEGNAINPHDVYDFDTNTLKDSVLTITPETFAYLKEARAIRRVTIRRGDTLSGLAVRYGVTVTKLCRLNGISRKTILRIGQKIRIN